MVLCSLSDEEAKVVEKGKGETHGKMLGLDSTDLGSKTCPHLGGYFVHCISRN